MAVLVEGISVVVKCRSVVERYRGGVQAFGASLPNGTMCSDGELARVGFMTPDDTRAFVQQLEGQGLRYLDQRTPIDMVVVDQRNGPTVACDWIEFGTTLWNGDPNCPIAVCRARPSSVKQIFVPNGWVFERSLSAQHRFVDAKDAAQTVKFVRSEGTVDVYVDLKTGQELYMARSNNQGPQSK